MLITKTNSFMVVEYMGQIRSEYWTDPVFGSDVVIFPGAVIGRPPMAPAGSTDTKHRSSGLSVVIGDECIIGANAVIYEDVTIGNKCLIGDGAVIREKVVIGDKTVIAINCKVGTRTTIGSNTRIMDLTNVASDARIGDNVFIGMGVLMGNDNTMGRKEDWVAEGPIIHDYATIGMGAKILPGVTIGRNALIYAGAVVTKDVPDHTRVLGIPGKVMGFLPEEERR